MSQVIGRRLTMFLAALGAAAVLMVAAASANASISLSPAGPYASAGQPVTVSGSLPGFASTATHVAVVNCRVTLNPATRCDVASATPGLVAVSQFTSGTPAPIEITVRRGPWDDYSFATGSPVFQGTQTTCRNTSGAGARCAINVSYYNVAGGVTTQLGAEAENILFS